MHNIPVVVLIISFCFIIFPMEISCEKYLLYLAAFRVPGSRDNLESTDMELDDDSAPIDVGGTSPLSGNLPPPPAPPVVLEARPPGVVPCPQPVAQMPSNGSAGENSSK